MSVRLEYWDATPPSGNPRWVQASISYGSATNNAVLTCDITERIGMARQAKVTLMNQGTAFNTVGPFTNEFTDFQRVRILEDEVNVVLFHGRIYDISIHADGSFGDVTTLVCYDNLRELQEYPTEHMKDPIMYGGGSGQFNKNSILIKNLVASDYASDSSANIPSSSIDFTNVDKFNASAVTLDADFIPAYHVNRGEKSILGQIAAIARQDPHSGGIYEDQYGYDYYLDSRFNKTTDYIASSNATLLGDSFNYFKRGTRPSTPGSPGTDGVNWKGLRIHRPTTTFTEAGNLIPMLDGSQFDKPKDDLFTSVILQFDESTKVSTVGASFDELEALGMSNDFVQPQIAPHDGRFLVEGLDGGTFGGSNSGVFNWEGRKFSARYEVSVNADTADGVPAELIRYTHQHSAGDTTHGEGSHGGSPNHIHTLGRVVYQSATTGTGLFLLTFEDKYEEKTFNYLCDQADAASSTLVLTGYYTNATYTFTPKTQRLKSKFGIQRPYRLKISSTNSLDAIRQEAANALSKSALPQLSGRFRTLRAPYYYVEMYANTHDGTDNTITITHIKQNSGSFATVGGSNTLANWGLKEGMTIAKVNSSGTQTAWGWITDITGAAITSNIRNATHDGDENWDSYTGSSNIIRVYIPVRTGHYTYVVNDAQAVNGYHFVEEVGYTETRGAVGTNFKTYGTNSSTYAYEGPYKTKLPQVLIAIDETSKNLGKLGDLPISMMPWQFTQADGSGETGKFTLTGRTGVTWTSGILKVGGLYTYKIRGGNVTLSTTNTGQVDGKPYEYIISFDGDQTPDGNNTYAFAFTARKDYIDDVDKLKLGWARAGLGTNDPVELSFSGSTSVGDFPIKNIGSALVRRGAQGFASDMKIAQASSAAHNKIQWAAFTIKFADQTTLSVNASGSDYNFGNHGSRTTYWMYVTIPASGAGTLAFANSYTTAFSDGKINLGTLVVEADSDSDLGNMPSVFPISSKEAVVSAGLIHANHLSAISANMGTLTSGRGIFGTNPTQFNSGASGADTSSPYFTGVAVGEPGTGTNGIGSGFTLRSQVNGVDQVYVQSGVLKAGLGNVEMDSQGLHLGKVASNDTTFNIFDTGGSERYRLRAFTGSVYQNSIGVPTLFAPTSGHKSFAPSTNNGAWLGYYDTTNGIARGWEGLYLGRIAGGNTGTNYGKTIKLEAQAGTQSELTNYTISLPPIPPTGTGQVLQTSGSSPFNELEWASNSGGGSYSGWAVSDGSNAEVVGSGAGVTFTGSNGITTSYSTSSNTLTINGSGLATSGHSHGGGGSYTHPDPIKLGAGSASAPTYASTANSGNSGLYFETSSLTTFALISIQGSERWKFGTSIHYTDASIRPNTNSTSNLVGNSLGHSTKKFNYAYIRDVVEGSSDATLKENLTPINNATAFLKDLVPYEYNFIADRTANVNPLPKHFGITAQNLKSTLDAHGYSNNTSWIDEVDDDDNHVQYNIREKKLIHVLIAAVKELEVRIKTLEGG